MVALYDSVMIGDADSLPSYDFAVSSFIVVYGLLSTGVLGMWLERRAALVRLKVHSMQTLSLANVGGTRKQAQRPADIF